MQFISNSDRIFRGNKTCFCAKDTDICVVKFATYFELKKLTFDVHPS